MYRYIHKLSFSIAIIFSLYSLCLLITYFFKEVNLTLRIQTTILFFLSSYVTILLYNQKVPLQKQQQNLHMLHLILCIIYISQLIHLLFFAAEFSRDHVTLETSYFEALKKQWNYNTNLQPFYTIYNMFQLLSYSGYLRYVSILNLFGNFIAFAPFSYFLPKLWAPMQKPKYFFTFLLCLICCVEILQFFTLTGSMDIDDLILNFIGAVCCYPLCRYLNLHKVHTQ